MDSQPVTSIADALFPRVRQRVLALVYGNPDRSFFVGEIVALAQSGTGAVQRELASLAEAGLLTVRTQGNQKHYQANPAAPVFQELRGLVLKTSGVVDVLRAALAPLASQISCAFVYGSVARQEDTATSDVDLMVITPTLGYADTFAALEAAGQQLGRKINPTVYSPEEWAKRRQQRNAFVSKVLQQPKLWLIGTEEQLHG
jgi:predicted nucleotidyltransferase